MRWISLRKVRVKRVMRVKSPGVGREMHFWCVVCVVCVVSPSSCSAERRSSSLSHGRSIDHRAEARLEAPKIKCRLAVT